MRRFTIWLLVVIMLAGLPGASLAAPEPTPATQTEPSDAPVFDAIWQLTAPVIDGDLGEWDGFPKIVLDQNTADWPPEGSRPAPDDLSAWSSLVWTTEYLYIALWVTDENIVRNSRNWFFDDMAQFTFDIDLDREFSLGDQRYTISPDGLLTDNGGLALGATSVVLPHANGWHAEVKVPLRDFGSDFLTNAEVGFTWGVQDDDGAGVRDMLVWAGAAYDQPHPDQGLMRFTNGPTREWLTFDTGQGWDGLHDTTVANWYPDRNFGFERNLFIRSVNDWNLLIQITPPELQPGHRPLRARLTFNVTDVQRGGTNTTRVYRMLRPWAEDEATWNQATAGDFWAIPGAGGIGEDREGEPVIEFGLGGTGEYTLDISPLMLDWYEHPENNHGIIFRAEDGTRRAITIEPSECGVDCGPVLEILVESPPPSAAEPAP